MLDKNHPDNDVVLDESERLAFQSISQDYEQQARNIFLGRFFGFAGLALIIMALVTCSL